jgi:hypothetical protein
MRHEMFHAVQFHWIQNVPTPKWITEGTAQLAVESAVNLAVSKDVYPRNVNSRLTKSEYSSNLEYKTQDFWGYVGKKRNAGLIYLKPLLQSGLKKPILDADTNIGYAGGLRSAYWDFVKDHGYERTIDIHEIGSPCRLAVFGGSAFVLNGTVVPEATINLGSSTVTSGPYTTEQLATRVIPIRFTNTDTRSVKVTLESKTGPALNYKVYEGTVPTSTTDCTNDPEGIVASGQTRIIPRVEASSGKAEDPLFPVNNKTELVIFVANTDFATASSFTVKVEAVGKPGMNIIPPAPLSIAVGSSRSGAFTVSNTGDIGSTLEYQVYNATQGSLDLASVNNRVSTATLRSTGIAKVYPPAPPFDTWNGGSISVGGGIGNLAKDASQTYSFAVNCTKPGGHTARIPVAYYTGEVNLSNVEQVAEADVSVQVECVGGPIPIPDNSNLSIVGLTEKPWVVNSNYTVSVFTVRNIGDAPYRYTPDGLADVGGILNEGDRSPDVIPVGGTKEFRVQADCPTSGPYRKTGLVSIKGLLGTSSAGINVRKEISVWCKPRDFNNTVFNEYLPAYYSGIENTYLVKIPNEWQACPGDSVYFDSTVNGANVAIVRPGTTTGQRNTFGDAAQVVNESGQIEMNIGAIGGSIANANISVSATLFEVDEGGTRTSVGNCVWNDATYKFTRIP